MKLKSLLIFILCMFPILCFSQQDSNFVVRKTLSTNPGGIFLAPTLSAIYPLGPFGENSKVAAQYGVRLEYASQNIYPFVVGALIEFTKHQGKDEFMTANILNVFETKTTAIGGSIDIILSKFIKTNFTIPFITLEAKYINVTRTMSPEKTIPGIELSQSELAYGGGAGFTLYIFDIYAKYSRSSSFSTFSVNTRFHFPLIKF